MRIKAKLAAGALFAAALIAGCTPPGGTAAVVNGDVITVAEVDDGMAMAPLFSQPLAPSNVLMTLMQARPMIAAAADLGMGVSADDAADFLDQIDGSAIRVDGEYSAAVLDITRMQLIVQEAQVAPEGEELFNRLNEFFNTAEIETNPRFGTWDISQGGLQQSLSDWIEFAG